jgi:colanic acid biosynthesis glycosyl transferase WcaI
MKFLIFTQYFAPEIGATPVRLAALAKELMRHGHDVQVVTGMPNHPHGRILPEYRGALHAEETWEGIRIRRVWLYAATGAGFGRVANYASFAATSVLALLRSERPDVIFVETPPPTIAIPAVLAARFWRSRLILNVSDLWPDSISALGLMQPGLVLWALSALERWMYRTADFTNAITPGVGEVLAAMKGIPIEKMLFLPNGVDTTTFRPLPPDPALKTTLGFSDADNIFIYAGTMGYAHALDTVIEAAELLRDQTGIQLLFIGDGSERSRLERMAADMRLPNVRFHDFVPPEELPHYLAIARAAVVSQRNVPLFTGNRPAKLFPIMACAKPIVFSGKGEGAELVASARAGVAVTPEDPRALVDAINTLSGESGLAAQFGANGRRFVEQNYTWSRLVSRWLADFEGKCLTIGDVRQPQIDPASARLSTRVEGQGRYSVSEVQSRSRLNLCDCNPHSSDILQRD